MLTTPLMNHLFVQWCPLSASKVFWGKRDLGDNEKICGGRKPEPKGKGTEFEEEGLPEIANAGTIGVNCSTTPVVWNGVLESLGCYTRIPQELINSRNLFCTALKDGILRLWYQHGWVRGLFWATDFLFTLTGRRGEESLWVSFIRTLTIFMRTPSSWPKHFQRPHLLISSPWALGFQNMNLGGIQTFRP